MAQLHRERVEVPLVGGGPKHRLDLYWAAWVAERTPLNALQFMRDPALAAKPKAVRLEETYWNELNRFRKWVALWFLEHGRRFDLLVEPPSRSLAHRPYLASLRRVWPDAAHCRFVRDRPVHSGEPGTTFEALASAVRLSHRPPRLRAAREVLIVDDVFGAGRTAAVLIDRLRPLVAKGARFSVFCPLRTGYLPAPAAAARRRRPAR